VDGELQVTISLCRRRVCCPQCSFSTRHRYDTREVDSSWRHLDMAGRVCRILLRRRRLRCPAHGVLAEGVPFERLESRHTRDFEDLVAWLVTKTDKTTVSGFARVAWRTVGAICERVAPDVLDPDRLHGLVDIGVDEISWCKYHQYLTLVSDHDTGTIVWGKPRASPARTLTRCTRSSMNCPMLRPWTRCPWTWGPRTPRRCGSGHPRRWSVSILCAAADYERGGARHVVEGRGWPIEDRIIRRQRPVRKASRGSAGRSALVSRVEVWSARARAP
jgi:hypothetical protein